MSKEVMDWGKEVCAVLKRIVAEQNEHDSFDDAQKTQNALTLFHDWLWDLADEYVHEDIAHYQPETSGNTGEQK